MFSHPAYICTRRQSAPRHDGVSRVMNPRMRCSNVLATLMIHARVVEPSSVHHETFCCYYVNALHTCVYSMPFIR